jgi:hypothetical protein
METAMETKAALLDEFLETVDELSPEELERAEKRLAAARDKKNGNAAAPAVPPVMRDIFSIAFADYLAMSDEERDAIQLEAYARYRQWIDEELRQRRARWMLVCGGTVIESSPTLRNYPRDEKFREAGERYGFIPFVFAAQPLIEESSWADHKDDDFYPRLSIVVAAENKELGNPQNDGLIINADFDTGSGNAFFDHAKLSNEGIIQRQEFRRANVHFHLGRPFRYHILPVLIGVVTEAGRVISGVIEALCVRDWTQSLFRLPNPSRQALVGRNVLTELPLQVKLDGRRRVTQILDEQQAR